MENQRLVADTIFDIFIRPKKSTATVISF